MTTKDRRKQTFYTTDQVMAKAGVLRMRLVRWCQQGLIPGQPAEVGSGTPRRWTLEQMKMAEYLARVLAPSGMTEKESNRVYQRCRQRAHRQLARKYEGEFQDLFRAELLKEVGDHKPRPTKNYHAFLPVKAS